MEKVIVDIYYTGNNYCAHAPILSGCVSTATTLSEMKKNIKEAIEFHVESSLEDGDIIPEVFKGEYELEFRLSIEALLNAYSDIFTKAALSRITGINQRQLCHYAPRATEDEIYNLIFRDLKNAATELNSTSTSGSKYKNIILV